MGQKLLDPRVQDVNIYLCTAASPGEEIPKGNEGLCQDHPQDILRKNLLWKTVN